MSQPFCLIVGDMPPSSYWCGLCPYKRKTDRVRFFQTRRIGRMPRIVEAGLSVLGSILRRFVDNVE